MLVDEYYDGVFKGGGALGIPYIGGLEYLQRNRKWFARTAGTSIGSLVAGMIAAGYPAVHETRSDCTKPGHLGCLKGLLYNSASERIAHLRPTPGELKAMIPGSQIDRVFDVVSAQLVGMAPPVEWDLTTIKAVITALLAPFGSLPLDSYAPAAAPPPTPPWTVQATLFPPPGATWAMYTFPAVGGVAPRLYLPIPAGSAAPPIPGTTLLIAPTAGPPAPAGLVAARLNASTLLGLVNGQIPNHVTAPHREFWRDVLRAMIDANPDIVVPGGLTAPFRDVFFMAERFGRYKNDDYNTWLKRVVRNGMIQNRPDATFVPGSFPESDVPSAHGKTLRQMTAAEVDAWNPTLQQMLGITGIHFTCIGASVSTHEMIVMNADETPGMAVADAITISGSAPFVVFPPSPFPGSKTLTAAEWNARFNMRGRPVQYRSGVPCVDGGITTNFPAYLFHEPQDGTGSLAPYITDAPNRPDGAGVLDGARRKLGFYLDSREPGTAPPPESRVNGFQAVPTPSYAGDAESLPPIVAHASDIIATSSATIDTFMLRRLSAVPSDRRTDVFIPVAPYDWLRFDPMDHELGELAARGWVATREKLHFVSPRWIAINAETRNPEPFVMVRCLADSTPSSPTVQPMDDERVMFAWKANDPSNRVFVATMSSQDVDTGDPLTSERTLTATSGAAVPGVTTRFGPALIPYGARLFGAATNPTTTTIGNQTGSAIDYFWTTPPGGGGPSAAAGLTNLTAGNALNLTNLAPSLSRDGDLVTVAWVAPDGRVRFAVINIYNPSIAYSAGPVDLTFSGATLTTAQPVSITRHPTGAFEIAWVDASSRVSVGVVSAAGVVTRTAQVSETTTAAPAITTFEYGEAKDVSNAPVSAQATLGWLKEGFLVSWVGAANQIRYTVLGSNGVEFMTPRSLREDSDVHTTAVAPAAVRAQAAGGRGTAGAHFAWRADNGSNKIFVARLFGFSSRE